MPADFETDPDRIAGHLQDAAHVPGGHAVALVRPSDEGQVADVLRRAPSVLAIGAQSSLTGGATPMGDVLLSTARLTSIDVHAGAVTAGAGVTLAELEAALAGADDWYPPVPTYAGATVGGIVATNAAGAATFKYGATRSWVRGLTVVLPDGDVLDLQRGDVTADDRGGFDLHLQRGMVRVEVPTYRLPPVAKVSAGYFAAPGMDLIDLFIGAEGTLGVVTSVTLRTLHVRPATGLMLMSCPSRAVALQLVTDLRARSQETWRARDPNGVDVCAIEHLDRRCLDLLRADGVDQDLDVFLPADTELALLVATELPPGMTGRESFAAIAGALDGTAPDSGLVRLCRLLHERRLLERTEFAGPDERARRLQLLALREAVPAIVNQRIGRAQRTIDARIEKVAADVVVPFDRVAALLDICAREFDRHRVDGAVWGHISDGNLHPNVMPRSLDEFEAGKAAVLAIGRAAMTLGGSPCAEHGVGRNRIKQQLIGELHGESAIDAMRAIKRALDPCGKLAPGVLGL